MSRSTVAPLDVAPGATRLALFGFLWAFALLYHQVGYDAYRGTAADLTLTIVAMVAMVWPATPSVLGGLAVAHIAVVLRNLPSVYNHWYFAALVSIAIAAAYAGTWWRHRGAGASSQSTQMASAFGPAGVWCLLLLYATSGFHKLNHDFLDPAVSCAPILGGGITAALAFVPAGPLAIASILLAVVTELGLPLLLLVPRFRHVGVAIGLLFHVTMSVAGYPRFSATGVALLTLLLADEALTMVPRGWLGRYYAAVRARGPATGGRLALVVVLIAAAIAGERVSGPVFLAVQLLFTFGMLVAVIGSRRSVGAGHAVGIPWRISLPMVAPALVLVSAMSPYLGLGTSRAFAMYSNLRTEGGVSNHLIVPAWLQPFSFQRDLVTIVESSAPQVQRLANDRLTVPFLELRSMLSTTGGDVRDGSVSYIRNGTTHDVPSIRADAALDLPASWVVQKFVRFRAIESSGQRQCGV